MVHRSRIVKKDWKFILKWLNCIIEFLDIFIACIKGQKLNLHLIHYILLNVYPQCKPPNICIIILLHHLPYWKGDAWLKWRIQDDSTPHPTPSQLMLKTWTPFFKINSWVERLHIFSGSAPPLLLIMIDWISQVARMFTLKT